ncbi:basic proline-rich protein-like [Camelus ferus]|uniref:Basic proline-rich protein-like n=1 Tax=Camelus ferus TaxID=419612 RepID=A0A8B8RZR7_CAMFR|nr:basic proline-rich protein-like [Camelus ferus]
MESSSLHFIPILALSKPLAEGDNHAGFHAGPRVSSDRHTGRRTQTPEGKSGVRPRLARRPSPAGPAPPRAAISPGPGSLTGTLRAVSAGGAVRRAEPAPKHHVTAPPAPARNARPPPPVPSGLALRASQWPPEPWTRRGRRAPGDYKSQSAPRGRRQRSETAAGWARKLAPGGRSLWCPGSRPLCGPEGPGERAVPASRAGPSPSRRLPGPTLSARPRLRPDRVSRVGAAEPGPGSGRAGPGSRREDSGGLHAQEPKGRRPGLRSPVPRGPYALVLACGGVDAVVTTQQSVSSAAGCASGDRSPGQTPPESGAIGYEDAPATPHPQPASGCGGKEGKVKNTSYETTTCRACFPPTQCGLECGHSVPEQLRVEPTLCPSYTTDSSSQEKPAPASSPGADTIPSCVTLTSDTFSRHVLQSSNGGDKGR